MTAARGLTRELWNDRTVAWYRRANERSDYAATVFAAAADVIDDCRTALDIGAGFGALALPLARRMERVTALEPSPAMARALRQDAARQHLANVTVIEAAYGDVPLAPHDLVLCAHVGPLLGRGSAFLREAPRLARRAVVFVRDVPGGEDKFFFHELYPALLGQPYERCCDYEETLAALQALGVRPVVTTISYRSDQPFESLEEACEFFMAYMGVTTAEARGYLRQFLGRRLIRRGDEWIAPLHKRAAVIRWRIGTPEVRS